MNKDSFLDRWSRRKQTAKSNTRPARAFSNLAEEGKKEPEAAVTGPLESPETPTVRRPPLATPEVGPAMEPESVPGAVDADTQAVDLPDPEHLTYESDFSGFLKEGVSEEVRRMALRKLWRSNPVLANLDGLNDYDEDFRKEAILGKLKTAYDSVKGFGQSDEAPEQESQEHKPSEPSEMSPDRDLEAENNPDDEQPSENAEAESDAKEKGSADQA
jgi:hypothetical protein